jgi:chromosome segregation ATPase
MNTFIQKNPTLAWQLMLRQLDEFKENQNDLKNQLEKKEQELTIYTTSSQTQQNIINDLTKQLNDLKNQLEKKEQELPTVYKERSTQTDELNFEPPITFINDDERLKEALAQIKKLRKRLQYKSVELNALQQELTNAQAKLETTQNKLEYTTQELLQNDQVVAYKINTQTDQINDLNNQINYLNDHINYLNHHISIYLENQHQVEQYLKKINNNFTNVLPVPPSNVPQEPIPQNWCHASETTLATNPNSNPNLNNCQQNSGYKLYYPKKGNNQRGAKQ